MRRDFIDLQSGVRERVRRLEISRGPKLFHTPGPWKPAYRDLDDYELVAYSLLPFTAFDPSSVPVIPAQAQYCAEYLRVRGFETDGQSRAFARTMLLAGGLPPPNRLVYDMTCRVDGSHNDPDGSEWRDYPMAKLLEWDMTDLNEKFRTDAGGWHEYRQVAGGYAPPEGSEVVGYASSEGFTYAAHIIGHRLWTRNNKTAFYNVGDEQFTCDYNQHLDWNAEEKAGWNALTEGPGIHNSANIQAPPDGKYWWDEHDIFCFADPAPTVEYPDGKPPNPSGDPTSGYWSMEGYDLDLLAACHLKRPPAAYRGEPAADFVRDPDHPGGYLTFPGIAEWVATVAPLTWPNSDWAVNWALWYGRRGNEVYHLIGEGANDWQGSGASRRWRWV